MVPRPTIGGNKNHNGSLFEMNYFTRECKTCNNGILFEITLTCQEMLK